MITTLDETALQQLGAQLTETAEQRRHRYLTVVAGESSWCRAAVRALLQRTVVQQTLWVSATLPEAAEGIHPEQFAQLLGREYDSVVFDGHSGFDPDALGVVSGAVRGGGLFILLMPPLAQWSNFHDPAYKNRLATDSVALPLEGRFLARLQRCCREAVDSVMVVQGQPIPCFQPSAWVETPAEVISDAACRSADQVRAVAAVMKVVTGHRRRPVVLTSDRGRGKSATLGIAAARLMAQGVKRIVVTAPRLEAVHELFTQAVQHLPGGVTTRDTLRWEESHLQFLPPDLLVGSEVEADCLMVDEAASLPNAILTELLKRYSRIVFATTVHGYEGTGRGFALRFNKVLDELTPAWRAVELITPIRWAKGDPLEQFTFDALLLNATLAPEEAINAATVESCDFDLVNRDTLLNDETLLSQLFALLVFAHYRTRPNDLRQLLDAPDIDLYVLRYQTHVVATALVIAEGGVDDTVATEIYAGKRRLPGHLLPQTMALQVGLERAAIWRYGRVMRIAVHPHLQRRGLGGGLVEQIAVHRGHLEEDMLGVSFGATPELLHFWQQRRFSVVRIGQTREQSSGCHAAVMLRAVTERGQNVIGKAEQRFAELLPHQLLEPLQQLEPALIKRVLINVDPHLYPRLSDAELNELVAFAYAHRGYEVNALLLWKLLYRALTDAELTTVLDEKSAAVLIKKIVQKQSWSAVAQSCQLAGHDGVLEAVRNAVRLLLVECGGQRMRAEVVRLGERKSLG